MSKLKLTVEDLKAGLKEELGFDPYDYDDSFAAVTRFGPSIRNVDKDIIDQYMIIVAVNNDPRSIKYVEPYRLNDTVLSHAVYKDPDIIKLIGDMGLQTEGLCKLAVQLKGETIRWVCKITHDLALTAVKKSGFALKHIPSAVMDHQICKIAIDSVPTAIKYANSYTEATAIKAVKRNPTALMYIPEDKQTRDVCLAAVNASGLVLDFVRNKTVEICAHALVQDNRAIIYVPTELFEQVVDYMNQDLGDIETITPDDVVRQVEKADVENGEFFDQFIQYRSNMVAQQNEASSKYKDANMCVWFKMYIYDAPGYFCLDKINPDTIPNDFHIWELADTNDGVPAMYATRVEENFYGTFITTEELPAIATQRDCKTVYAYNRFSPLDYKYGSGAINFGDVINPDKNAKYFNQPAFSVDMSKVNYEPSDARKVEWTKMHIYNVIGYYSSSRVSPVTVPQGFEHWELDRTSGLVDTYIKNANDDFAGTFITTGYLPRQVMKGNEYESFDCYEDAGFLDKDTISLNEVIKLEVEAGRLPDTAKAESSEPIPSANHCHWIRMNILGINGYLTSCRVDKTTIPEGFHVWEISHDGRALTPFMYTDNTDTGFYGTFITSENLPYITEDDKKYYYFNDEYHFNDDTNNYTLEEVLSLDKFEQCNKKMNSFHNPNATDITWEPMIIRGVRGYWGKSRINKHTIPGMFKVWEIGDVEKLYHSYDNGIPTKYKKSVLPHFLGTFITIGDLPTDNDTADGGDIGPGEYSYGFDELTFNEVVEQVDRAIKHPNPRRLDAITESWLPMYIRGVKGYFNDCRINRDTVPKIFNFWELADGDSDGTPCRYKPGIMVNFYGTFITTGDLPIDDTKEAEGFINSEDDYWFDGSSLTFTEMMADVAADPEDPIEKEMDDIEKLLRNGMIDMDRSHAYDWYNGIRNILRVKLVTTMTDENNCNSSLKTAATILGRKAYRIVDGEGKTMKDSSMISSNLFNQVMVYLGYPYRLAIMRSAANKNTIEKWKIEYVGD